MPGWLIGAALGAGLSALQSAQANADQKRAKRKYLEYLDKIKVNPLEEQKLLDSTGDVYMGQTMDALNSSVGQGNLYNRDTMTSLIKAKGLSARAGAQAQQKQSIFDFNKKVDMQKANAELQMPDQSLDFGAIAAGGLAGAQVGMGIESAIAENELYDAQKDWWKKLGNDGTGLQRIGSIGTGKTLQTPLSAGLNINIPPETAMLSAKELYGSIPNTVQSGNTGFLKGLGTGVNKNTSKKSNVNLPGIGFTPPGGMGMDLTANQDIKNTPSRGINQWWQGGTKRMPEMVTEQSRPVSYIDNPYQVPNYNTVAETSTTGTNKFGKLKKGQQTGYLQNLGYQNVLNTPIDNTPSSKLVESELGMSGAGYNVPGLDTPGESALDLAAFLPIGAVTNRFLKEAADRYAIKKGVTGLAKFKAGRSKFLEAYERRRLSYIDKMLNEGKSLTKPVGFNYWK